VSTSARSAEAPRPEPAVQIRRLEDTGAGRWDAFVESCPAATFYHRAGWRRVIERTFGYPTFYLYAEAGGEMCGVLPLGQVKSRLFGNSLISVPFLTAGGAATEDPQALEALERAALQLARERAVDWLELRYARRVRPDLEPSKLYVSFAREIQPDPEANLKAVPRKQRAMIRKGMQAGLESTVDAGVDRFFRLFSESQRNLGTPVLPARWFRAIREEFGDACEVLTVTRGAEPVSSVMSFYFRDRVLPYYGGGGEHARELKANDFMYWELMRRACECGVRVFDYGRSKLGTGSFSFKKNWGFEPEPLYYDSRPIRAQAVPDINPLNPKYRLAVRAWRRLPLPLSRLLGPMVARQLG